MALWVVPSVGCVIALLCFGYPYNPVTAASGDCSYIDSTADKCRGSDRIRVEDQVILKNTNGYRVTLPGLQTEVTWYCGSSKERAAWGERGNQLRVNYLSDGTIQWRVYKCADLSGPKSAGEKCAIVENGGSCPKVPGQNSTACVWELKKSTANVNSKTTTVSVEGTLQAQINEQVSAEVKVGVSHSVTKAKIVKYESKTYMVIPPGYTFCSLTENTSEEDVHAPTGFSWKCANSQFVQTDTGKCTELNKCGPGVCGAVSGAGVSVQMGISVLILGVLTVLMVLQQ